MWSNSVVAIWGCCEGRTRLKRRERGLRSFIWSVARGRLPVIPVIVRPAKEARGGRRKTRKAEKHFLIGLFRRLNLPLVCMRLKKLFPEEGPKTGASQTESKDGRESKSYDQIKTMDIGKTRL